jgi:hypothetical protein
MEQLPIEDQWIVDALAASDRDHAIQRLLYKVQRQRDALDALNRRTTTLRFAIRVHESLHGQLGKDEWKAARDAVTNEAHRERIDAEVAVA